MAAGSEAAVSSSQLDPLPTHRHLQDRRPSCVRLLSYAYSQSSRWPQQFSFRWSSRRRLADAKTSDKSLSFVLVVISSRHRPSEGRYL